VRAVLAAVVLALLLSGCATIPGYRYEEQQLGRRTWEVRAGDSWPGARLDLERFVLYRAAERTRETGFHHFAIRETTVDPGRARFFAVNPGVGPRIPYPPVSEGSEVGTAVDRLNYFYRTPYSELRKRWQHVKFRMLREDEIGPYPDVLDARRVLAELGPFIARRR
jgi:hypothetical protein